MIDATNWVLRNSVPTTAKFVLMVLAFRANAQAQCWPSMATLSKDLDMSDTSIRKYLKLLEREGLITIERRQGQSSLYTITGYIATTGPEPPNRGSAPTARPTPEHGLGPPPKIKARTPEPVLGPPPNTGSDNPSENHKKENHHESMMISSTPELEIWENFEQQITRNSSAWRRGGKPDFQPGRCVVRFPAYSPMRRIWKGANRVPIQLCWAAVAADVLGELVLEFVDDMPIRPPSPTVQELARSAPTQEPLTTDDLLGDFYTIFFDAPQEQLDRMVRTYGRDTVAAVFARVRQMLHAGRRPANMARYVEAALRREQYAPPAA